MKGYKVFNPDWTCRGYQFEVGKTFTEDVTPVCCDSGFHFCTKAVDCFKYYAFSPNNKVAEVEALGEIVTNNDDSKCSTNKIHIIREITWHEVLDLVNLGKACTGLRNSGNRNSGDNNSGNHNIGNRNSGDANSGDVNSGDVNSGNRNSGNDNIGNANSGDDNSGDYNSGDCNSGNRNSGNDNSGDDNSGDYNSGNGNSGNRNGGDNNSGNHNIGDDNSGDDNNGDCNSGNRNSGNGNSGNGNSGNRNSGDCNSGNYNSGDYNSGNRNSGDYNSGDGNSGNYNSGHYNSGDWNKTHFSNGCFNTELPKIFLFNKPSDWTYQDWLDSDARYILMNCPTNALTWVWDYDMTEEEKEQHPEYSVTGGFLKNIEVEGERQEWWDSLTKEKKDSVMSLPNFDKNIFKEITGIDVNKFVGKKG